MVKIFLNGTEVWAEDFWTILDTAKFYGINIPTLCHFEGLEEYGGCRMCLVEVGDEKRSKLVTSCTHPLWEKINIRTHSKRAVNSRKMVLELLVARTPQSKVLQDMASQMGLKEVRFKPRNEDCILCGLCVRICKEQMQSGSIGFVGRGETRDITTPFDIATTECRRCGGCIYICPACQMRCEGPDPKEVLCNRCMNMSPSCLESYDDVKCYMSETSCGTCIRESNTTTDKNKSDMEIEK